MNRSLIPWLPFAVAGAFLAVVPPVTAGWIEGRDIEGQRETAAWKDTGPQGSIPRRGNARIGAGSIDSRMQCSTGGRDDCQSLAGIKPGPSLSDLLSSPRYSSAPGRENPATAPQRGSAASEGKGPAGSAEGMYEVTAYSHGCAMHPGPEPIAARSASGRWPIADVTIAADTRIHPFGTELLIEGVGFRTVHDRGRLIKGRRLDLFVDTCREARRFGRRWLSVWPVPRETTEEER